MYSCKHKIKAAAMVGILLPAALWLSSCTLSDPTHSHDQDAEARAPFLYQLAADGVTQFSIRGISGDIFIDGEADADTVEVWGERVVRSDDPSDAEEQLDRLTVEVRKNGTEIAVHTDQPNHSGGRSYMVNYHVRLPDSMKVGVQLTNGTVSIDGISNSVRVESTNGNIDCRKLRGDCAVALVNGEIDCEVALPGGGTCTLAAVNGNVNLAVPDTVSAQMEAKVTNGSVSVSGLQIKNMKSSRTSVTGTLGDGTGLIQVSTVNGNIDILGK
jgi:hypothetical protein